MITQDKRDKAIKDLAPSINRLHRQDPSLSTAIAAVLVDTMITLFSDTPVQFKLEIDEISQCQAAWVSTLNHFGITRPILPYENIAIAQLIKVYGWKSVLYALTGMRFEQKTATFDPSKNIAIARLRDSKLFEKFVNLAAQKKKEQELKNGN